MKVLLHQKRDRLLLQFQRVAPLVRAVKALSDYRDEGDDWSCAFTVHNARALKEMGATFSQKAQQAVQSKMESAKHRREEIERIKNIPGLQGTLRQYQLEGVHFIERMNGRALIGDEMGLGKTIQALAWLQLHPELRPAVIVSPSAVKLNWEEEAVKWMEGVSTFVAYGMKPPKVEPPPADLIFVNYHIFSGWKELILNRGVTAIVVDECHYLKNKGAKRTKAFKDIAKKIPNIIALSGTPITNRPEEFYTILNIMDPVTFPSWWDYVNRFCDAKFESWGWDTSGCSNVEELHDLLRTTIMIRRTKDEVLKELPPKSRRMVPVEMDNRQEYRRFLANFKEWVIANGVNASASALVRVQKLRELAVKGKMRYCLDWIQDFLMSGQKLVLFAWHTAVIDEVEKAFKEITVRVDGGVGAQEKQRRVKQFQTDPNIRLFVGNYKAAGIGITLTAASNVAFIELPWSPGNLVQAEDRCHRIGQLSSVNIWYLVAQGTVETYMSEILEAKAEVLGKVLDGKAVQLGILGELIKRLQHED